MDLQKLPENWNDRPDDYLGESSQSSYLQEGPRRKLKTSWVAGQKDEEEAKDKGPPAGRRSSEMVTKKLSELGKQNEGNHSKNTQMARRHTEAAATIPALKSFEKSAEKEEEEEEKSPFRANQQKISLQRKNVGFMAERPNDWMGGEGEEAIVNSYLQKPKTKLRTTWLNGDGMSQSMRDLTLLDPREKKKDGEDPLHQSESQFFKAKKERRQTPSPLVLEKLSKLKQKNEENHKANEELAVEKKAAKPIGAVAAAIASSEANRAHEKAQAEKAAGLEKSKAAAKVKFQNDPDRHLTQRPEAWMGGEGEAADIYSYLQTPKTTLKKSWLNGGVGMSQSMRDLSSGTEDDLNASGSQLFLARRRETSPKVMERLLDLKKQNEENHERNLEFERKKAIAAETGKTESPKPPKAPKAKTKEEEPEAKETTKISIQHDAHLTERPTAWMGGEGEEVELSYLQKPKTKLRTSWLQGTTGSQSLRDLSAGPDDAGNGRKDTMDQLNASESQLSTAQRRKTSPLIMQKLTGLSQRNLEVHEANEGLEIHKSPRATKPKVKKETNPDPDLSQMTPRTAAKEKIRLQRQDHNSMAMRPDDWMGGSSAISSPRRTPKKGEKGRIKSPFLLQNPLVDADEKEEKTP